jgi:hypothetical protein
MSKGHKDKNLRASSYSLQKISEEEIKFMRD